jgi:hypothetical protein
MTKIKVLLLIGIGFMLGTGTFVVLLIMKLNDAPYSLFHYVSAIHGISQNWEEFNRDVNTTQYPVIKVDYYRVDELSNYKNVFHRVDPYDIKTVVNGFKIKGSDIVYAMREGVIVAIDYNEENREYCVILSQADDKKVKYEHLKSIGKNIKLWTSIPGGTLIGHETISEVEMYQEMLEINKHSTDTYDIEVVQKK